MDDLHAWREQRLAIKRTSMTEQMFMKLLADVYAIAIDPDADPAEHHAAIEFLFDQVIGKRDE
jgi:hypothetical protein